MAPSKSFIAQYPASRVWFVHLFLRGRFGYRSQDGFHRSRSTGVYCDLESRISRDDIRGRREALGNVPYGTLCMARIGRGGNATHVTQ